MTILFSCFLSVSYIEQDKAIIEVSYQILSLFLLFVIVFIPSFFLSGIYTTARSYSARKKYLKIINSSLIAGIVIVIIVLLFREYFNLEIPIRTLVFSDISIAWFLILTGSILSRAWLYLYSKVTFSAENIEDLKIDEQRVLVIGGAGFIGSALIGQLLSRGFRVKVMDLMMFGEEPLSKYLNNDNFNLIRADFRKIDDLVLAMRGCSSVIHLGGIVGDPASSLDETVTKEVNLTSTKIIGQIAKSAGVKKFIFASSCSVYGAQSSILDETSSTQPLSLYAQTKIASERVLSELSSPTFAPVFLRFGTVYGVSRRTRFDLVVNLLTAKAFVDKSMFVYGPEQVRPFVHVADAALSIVLTLSVPMESINNQVFNIGSDAQNLSLLDVAEIIKTKIPDAKLNIEESNADARNYNVTFKKARNILKFKPKWSIEQGIDQVIQKFQNGEIEDYTKSKYSNYLHLSEEGLSLLNPLHYSGWEEDFINKQSDK